MDAEKYLKERTRMTGDCSLENCEGCALNNKNNGRNLECVALERKYPKVAIKLVKNWAKEHPVKTYKSLFLEKFPDAKAYEGGEPRVCIEYIFGKSKKPCNCNDISCSDCWNWEAEE